MNFDFVTQFAFLFDNEFSTKLVTDFCKDNNIRLDSSIAKTDHISNGYVLF